MVRIILNGVSGTAAGPSTDGGPPEFVSQINTSTRRISIRCANYPEHRQFIQLPEGWTFRFPTKRVEVHADRVWLVDGKDEVYIQQAGLQGEKGSAGCFPAASLQDCDSLWKLSGQDITSADAFWDDLRLTVLEALACNPDTTIPLYKVWGKAEYVQAGFSRELVFRKE